MINFFDLGAHDGGEIDLFLDAVKEIETDYRVYSFEANPELYEKVKNKFIENEKIKVYNLAINNQNEKVNLYIETTLQEGSSIFPSKKNVSKSKYFEVDGVLFSSWLEGAVPDYQQGINILRFNIEGAELYLMEDIIENNIRQHFDLFLGSLPDIPKIPSIKDKMGYYDKLLQNNNIEVEYFCKIEIRNMKRIDIKQKMIQLLQQRD